MKPKYRSGHGRLSFFKGASVIAFVTLSAISSVQAQTSGTWSSTASGTWSNTANWTGGTIPDLGGSANFASVDLPGGAVVVTVDSARNVGSLTFADTNLSTAGTWSVALGGFLTISSSHTVTTDVNTAFTGAFATHLATDVLQKQGTATLDLAGLTAAWPGPANLSAGTVRFRSGQSSVATIAGALTGNGTMLVAQGTNDTFQQHSDFSGFTGKVVCGSGNFRYGTSSAAPTAAQANGSQVLFDLGAGGSLFYRNGTNSAVTILLGALEGTTGSRLAGGGSAGGGTVFFNVGEKGLDTTFGGAVVDGATKSGLTKVGSSTLTLSGASTHSGATSVNEGTLVLSPTGTFTGATPTTISNGSIFNVNGTHSGAGNTTVAAGSYLTGTGSFTGTGTITVANSGYLSPGNDDIGNLKVSKLSFATGGIYNVEFGSGNDTVTVQSGGTLTLASGVFVDVNGFDTNGTYTLFNVTGATVSGSVATAFTAIGGNSSKIYSFANTGTAITMTIGTSDPTNYWKVNGAGTWNLAANWTKNVIPDAAGAIAKIGQGPSGQGGDFSDIAFGITLDSEQTVGSLAIEDLFTDISINAGTTTPGSLLFDNGASAASLTLVKGNHTINAPSTVDAEGVAVDVAPNYTLSINGVISGSSISKSGAGTLVLGGTNTYSGGTQLVSGLLSISSAANLGNNAGSLNFAGGTLIISGPVTGVTRSFRVTDANNAIIDTNEHDFSYSGVISSLGGSTGGLTKQALGRLTLTGAHTYTGTTTVNGGIVDLATGGSINAGALNVAGIGGAQFVLSGGTLTSGLTANIGNGSLGLLVTGGTANLSGGINSIGNQNGNRVIGVNGGTLNTAYISLGRGSTNFSFEPVTGAATGDGFYVTGGTTHITGALTIGINSTGVNSSATSRIDGGSVTVDGMTLIGLNNGGRWSVLDINGGTFTSNEAATGVQLGNNYAGSALFLVRAGTATVERFALQQVAASVSTSRIRVNGGSLYIGTGGIVGNNNGGTAVLDVQLGAGTLAAKGSWTSAVGVNLNGGSTIKAADAANAPFDITLSGPVTGTGEITKTGTGVLTLSGTNTYAGATAVSAGTVAITGDSSGATGEVSVATGATLAGNGNIGGNVTIASGAHHSLAVAATSGAQVTRVISGVLTLTAGNILDLTAAAPSATGTYILVTATGGIVGTPTTVNLGGGLAGTVSVVGNSLQLTVAGSAYSSWASTNGLTSGNNGPNQDPDFDGIANSLEFALGGNPLVSSTAILPTAVVNATNYVFSFNRSDASEAEVALIFQYGSDLTGWTDVPVPAATASQVVVTENGAAADNVVITIPRGANTKLFGRIKSVK